MVIGKRTPETLRLLITSFARRTNGCPPVLLTTDAFSDYKPLLMSQYGTLVVPPPTGRPGRPRSPYLEWPEGSAYATVTKTFKANTVHQVQRTLVFGTQADLAAALEASPVSHTINTAFVERQNGTERARNARKVRKTLRFSKSLLLHVAVSWWVLVCYNFHDLHRGLRLKTEDGRFLHRTPAMAIGLTQRPLSICELIQTQIVGPIHRGRPALPAFESLVTLENAP